MKSFIILFSAVFLSLISCNKDAESCCSLEGSKECKVAKDSTACKEKDHKLCEGDKDHCKKTEEKK